MFLSVCTSEKQQVKNFKLLCFHPYFFLSGFRVFDIIGHGNFENIDVFDKSDRLDYSGMTLIKIFYRITTTRN